MTVMSLGQGGGLGYSLLFRITWIALDLLFCQRSASLFLLTLRPLLELGRAAAAVSSDGRTVSRRKHSWRLIQSAVVVAVKTSGNG